MLYNHKIHEMSNVDWEIDINSNNELKLTLQTFLKTFGFTGTIKQISSTNFSVSEESYHIIQNILTQIKGYNRFYFGIPGKFVTQIYINRNTLNFIIKGTFYSIRKEPIIIKNHLFNDELRFKHFEKYFGTLYVKYNQSKNNFQILQASDFGISPIYEVSNIREFRKILRTKIFFRGFTDFEIVENYMRNFKWEV